MSACSGLRVCRIGGSTSRYHRNNTTLEQLSLIINMIITLFMNYEYECVQDDTTTTLWFNKMYGSTRQNTVNCPRTIVNDVATYAFGTTVVRDDHRLHRYILYTHPMRLAFQSRLAPLRLGGRVDCVQSRVSVGRKQTRGQLLQCLYFVLVAVTQRVTRFFF